MALAKENGVMLSEKDAERVCEMFNSEALTDEELDQIVGGGELWKSGSDPRTCSCDKESKIER